MNGSGRGGRRFAYFGVIVGLTVSVAANVAHAAGANVVHAASGPRGASPWALCMAGFWPVALFLSLEIISRTEWSGGRGLLVARVGVAVVALVAAALSYAHLRGLLATFGEASWAASLGPLAVDGLMGVSAAALLAHKQHEPSATAVTTPVTAAVVETTTQLVAAPAATEPAPATRAGTVVAPPRRAGTARRKAGAPPRPVGDVELLARVDAAVAAGQIGASDVTLSRLRTLLGVGSSRAARLSAAWHEQHRRTAVAAVAAVGGS